jgi:hypothetical protein
MTHTSIAVGDLDADTDHDLAITNTSTNNISVFLQVSSTGYARPKAATPTDISLVPAFNECISSNGSHGAPLASPSCNPPIQSSSFLTFNAPDRSAPYNTSVAGTGSLSMKVYCTNNEVVPCPTAGDQLNVRLDAGLTDVRCVAATGGCSSAGGTYSGKVLFRIPIRMTDRLNDVVFDEAGTVPDVTFEFGVQCSAGSCNAVTTNADAVIPDLVKEQKRAIWQLGRVEVLDGGSDGNLGIAPSPGSGSCPPACVGNGGETVFLRQGLFAP